MRALGYTLTAGALGVAAFFVFVPKWTSLPVGGIDVGVTPTSQIQFPRGHIPEPVSQLAPPPLPTAPEGGPAATAVYKNVQVLTDVSADEFMRLQHAITQWVSPKQGCGFCHTGEDYASDAKPTKAAARLMLRMTRHVNTDWSQHVAPSGVTCFTCHRGQPVPAETWFPSPPRTERRYIARQDNWRESADTVRKFFPDAGWDMYYLQDTPISVLSQTALPSGTVATAIVATRVYEMMMQMSDGIGVNCTYCHNSRAFSDWSQSTPARWTGYDAIRLMRDLNRNFLLQLAGIVPQTRARVHETDLPVLPAAEAGTQVGNGLAVCATCHYGEPRPLNGAAMLRDYPGLGPLGEKAATALASPPPG